MKQRTLEICLVALLGFATTSAARADTFDFGFPTSPLSNSSALTGSQEASPNHTDITDVAGSIQGGTGSSAITSLAGADSFGRNDNKLIHLGVLLGTKLFDSDGVSFSLANGYDINLNDTWNENAVRGKAKGPAIAAIAFIDLSRNSPVPEPGGLALFGTGILGVAGALRLKLRFS